MPPLEFVGIQIENTPTPQVRVTLQAVRMRARASPRLIVKSAVTVDALVHPIVLLVHVTMEMLLRLDRLQDLIDPVAVDLRINVRLFPRKEIGVVGTVMG